MKGKATQNCSPSSGNIALPDNILVWARAVWLWVALASGPPCLVTTYVPCIFLAVVMALPPWESGSVRTCLADASGRVQGLPGPGASSQGLVGLNMSVFCLPEGRRQPGDWFPAYPKDSVSGSGMDSYAENNQSWLWQRRPVLMTKMNICCVWSKKLEPLGGQEQKVPLAHRVQSHEE